MIRLGIVGAGAIGKAHKKAILSNADCTISAICDVIEENARKLAEGTDAKIYDNYYLC